MRKSLLLLSILLPQALTALPKKPWLGNVYEFFLDTSYTFSFYRRVANGEPGTHHSSNDNQFFVGLGFTPSEYYDLAVEAEVSDTTRQSWNVRSAAIQGRYLWLDDILGDPLSLTTGVSIRGVHHSSLKDISCPYSGEANFELNMSLGKEWSRGPFWNLRTFGYGAVGIANRGSPWTQFLAVLETNHLDKYRFNLFARGDFGFGNKNFVNVNHFLGYGSIHHQSVDIGAGYRRMFDLWGSLTFEYAHRVYAHAYPQGTNFFTLWYHLPFSLF
ncbi:MAG: hypothetical protein HYX48_04255 [Chlamydiales bacterium]|nr:hypothetical protein [Chlamydiales bacterium]